MSSSLTNKEKVALFLGLADNLKRLEQTSFVTDAKGDLVLPPGVPFMARLDGHCFAQFTRGLARPFDRRLAAAMRRTAADLFKEFGCDAAYTHSDEITLLFLPRFDDVDTAAGGGGDDDGDNDDAGGDAGGDAAAAATAAPVARGIIFNGRVHKINSLLSSFCAARFAFHIGEQFAGVQADVPTANDFVRSGDYDDDYVIASSALVGLPVDSCTYKPQTLAKMRSFSAMFDSRLLAISEPQLVREYFAWRQQHDCRRNSTHALARALFSTKQLNSVSVPAMGRMLDTAGVRYEAMDAQFRQGCFIKRKLVRVPGVDRKTGQAVVVTRARIVFLHNAITLDDTDAQLEWLRVKTLDD